MSRNELLSVYLRRLPGRWRSAVTAGTNALPSHKRFLLALLSAALVIGAWQTPAQPREVLSGQSATFREGPLEFQKIIPVLLNAGAGGESETARLIWLNFEEENGRIHADLRIVLVSYPKGKWRVWVALSNAAGRELDAQDAVFENSGTVLGRPGIREGDLQFNFGPAEKLSEASRFRVEVHQTADDVDVTSELVSLPREDAAPRGERSLELKIRESGGEVPGKVDLTVWRKADCPLSPAPLSAIWHRPVEWKTGDATWRAVRHISVEEGSHTVDGLPEGFYRVTAVSGWLRGSEDPTPVGETEPIDLTGTRTTARTELPIQGGQPLTVRLVDPESREPLQRECVLLRDMSGMPVGPGSRGFCRWSDDTGRVVFANLRAGPYRLEIGPRGWWYELHPQSVKIVRGEIGSDRGSEITVPFRRSEPAH